MMHMTRALLSKCNSLCVVGPIGVGCVTTALGGTAFWAIVRGTAAGTATSYYTTGPPMCFWCGKIFEQDNNSNKQSGGTNQFGGKQQFSSQASSEHTRKMIEMYKELGRKFYLEGMYFLEGDGFLMVCQSKQPGGR